MKSFVDALRQGADVLAARAGEERGTGVISIDEWGSHRRRVLRSGGPCGDLGKIQGALRTQPGDERGCKGRRGRGGSPEVACSETPVLFQSAKATKLITMRIAAFLRQLEKLPARCKLRALLELLERTLLSPSDLANPCAFLRLFNAVLGE